MLQYMTFYFFQTANVHKFQIYSDIMKLPFVRPGAHAAGVQAHGADRVPEAGRAGTTNWVICSDGGHAYFDGAVYAGSAPYTLVRRGKDTFFHRTWERPFIG